MKTKPSFSMKDAIEGKIYRTDVLKDYEGGKFTELQGPIQGARPRSTYKVQKDSSVVVFKTISCSDNDKECIDQVRKEYELALKASDLSDGVIKPLAYKEGDIKYTHKLYIEMVYEYGGNDLYSLLGKADAKKVTDIMSKVAETMTILEAEGIFHSDIRPANIVVKGDEVKILDFGVSNKFKSATQTTLSKTLVGGNLIYLPPEVFSSKDSRIHPGKIDVYGWGMTFYQMLTGKSNADLQSEMELRNTNYSKFLDNVKNMKLKGDSDGSLKKMSVEILLSALSIDNKERPIFAELVPLLLGKSYYPKRLLELADERDKIKKEYQELNNLHKNCVIERNDLEKKVRENDKIIKQLKLKSSSKLSTEKADTKSLSKTPKTSSITLKDVNLFLQKLKSENGEAYREVNKAYNGIKSGANDVLISNICIGDIGAIIIAQALMRESKLKELTLGLCSINIDGAKELAIGLSHCKTLKGLRLGRYRWSYYGSSWWGNAGSSNENNNNFELEGTEAIADYLEESSLEWIDLSCCNISEGAMKSLIEAANSCKTLKGICIACNPEVDGPRSYDDASFKEGLNVLWKSKKKSNY